MSSKRIKANIKLPNTSDVQHFTADCLEAFTSIDEYWMKRDGLVFFQMLEILCKGSTVVFTEWTSMVSASTVGSFGTNPHILT